MLLLLPFLIGRILKGQEWKLALCTQTW